MSFVTFSPDGRCLLVQGDESVCLLHDSGRLLRIGKLAETDDATFIDAEHVMTVHIPAHGPCWLDRWDVATGAHLGTYHQPPGYEFVMRYDEPVRRHILMAATDDVALTANLPTWIQQLPGIDYLLGANVHTYRVVDGLTDRLLGEYRLFKLNRVVISPDGRTLVIVSLNGTIEFWDIPARTPRSRVAVAALLWALPVAWLAHRRDRTLARSLSRSS